MWNMWQDWALGHLVPLNSRGRKLSWSKNNPNLGFRPQQGWNSKPNLPFGQQQGTTFNNSFQPTLKDLVYGQKQINDNITRKFLTNDKILESMAAQLEGFNSVTKNQLSFNKMIETQVAQLALSFSNNNPGKLPEQPEVPPKENISVVTTRTDKSTQEPPFPKDAGSRWKAVTANDTSAKDEEQEEAKDSNTTATQEATMEPPRTSREYHDTIALPFLERMRKPVANEQFDKFVEVIKKLYVNKPLLYAM